MELLEKQLRVKKSIIPNAGKGLFTSKPIKKGERIVEYKGTITTWKDVNHENGTNGYIFHVKRTHVIDARYHKDSLARYANDARGLVKIKGITNNAEYEEKGVRVFIVAKRDIPAGGEIMVGYGKEYWDVIRHNMKVDKDAEKEALKAKKAKSSPGKKSVLKKKSSKKSSAKKTTLKKSSPKKSAGKKSTAPKNRSLTRKQVSG